MSFLPSLFRRRCSALSRLMLHVAYAACESESLATLPTVFASRYGELALTLSLLDLLARSEPLTAAGFTHSVHNTQVGLFSISTKNREMATALSAGVETFPCAILEALALTERAGGGAALLVIADEPVPSTFEAFDDEPTGTYALALIIERASSGHGLRLVPSGDPPRASRPAWPQAMEFLRWLLSEEPSLTLGRRRPWTWHRS